MPIKPAAPRTAPKIKPPTTAEAKRTAAVALPSASATARYEAQASQEWDRAPRARGWSGNGDMRELPKGSIDTEQGAVDDIRAFSQSQWMAFRVPDLKSAEDNVRIPHWR